MPLLLQLIERDQRCDYRILFWKKKKCSDFMLAPNYILIFERERERSKAKNIQMKTSIVSLFQLRLVSFCFYCFCSR